MHDYYVNSRFRFGIITEFDVWLAQLLYMRAVWTTRNKRRALSKLTWPTENRNP